MRIFIFVLFCFFSLGAVGREAAGLIVHFKEGGRFAAEAPAVSHWISPQVAVIHPELMNSDMTISENIDRLQKVDGVRLVELDAVGNFSALDQAPVPNDPLFSTQKWLDIIGARRLWALGNGRGVVVAVIDSGVDLTHPDLKENLLPGYDFADLDDSPQDHYGHGTVVAGLLAAVGNNGNGVIGLAPGVKVVPFKISPDGGAHANAPLSSAVAAAILRATAMKVDFINLSLTITEETEAVRQAVLEALAQGVIVVAAAGNDYGQPVGFPANIPGVIAVANSADDGSLDSSSNFGPEIALAAPGASPTTTLLGGKYGTRGSGTSYSSPIVVATLAVLRSANPNWSKSTLLAALQASAKPVPGYRFGSLQAGAAAVELTPDLLPQSSFFAGTESLNLAYRLPDSGTSVDIYVAVDTPAGSFSLRPDGGWQAVADSGYVPVLANYVGGRRSGNLFGGSDFFPALPLRGLPLGNYQWRVGLVDHMTKRLLGPVIATSMTIGAP